MIAYQTVLKQRTTPVREEDFHPARGLLVHDVAVEEGVEHHSVSRWDNIIPYYPADIARVFTEGYSNPVAVNISPERNFIDVAVSSTQTQTMKAGLSLVVEGGTRRIDDSDIQVESRAQGKGAGRSWFRSIIEFSLAMGLNKLNFYAGLETGGYTWARAGAKMDMDFAEARKHTHTSRQLLGRLESLREYLDTNLYREARAFCRLVDKNDIVRLAHFDAVIPADAVERERLVEKMKRFYKENPPPDGAIYTSQEETATMMHAFRHAAASGKGVTLSKMLLLRTRWAAVVDFSDAGQMEDIGRYVGGWRTIEPSATP